MQTKTVTPLPATVKPGVVTGTALVDLLSHAKENGYAIPAVNVVSSCSISGCLEAAKVRCHLKCSCSYNAQVDAQQRCHAACRTEELEW